MIDDCLIKTNGSDEGHSSYTIQAVDNVWTCKVILAINMMVKMQGDGVLFD